MIRVATQEDLRRIVEMSEKFYPHTSYWIRSQIPFDPIAVATLASGMIDNGVFHVAEHDGNVIGMIGLVVHPFIFNPEYIVAGEIIWWVEPEYWNKGVGAQLLFSIEAPAHELGVRQIQMIDLVNSTVSAEALYTKFGYNLTERIFTKVI